MTAELIISTAPIDELLAFQYGALEWKGYRIEVDRASEPPNGYAPDGVPFAWLYTPWEGTPVCRTTDFGVIHEGSERRGDAVVLREIPDDGVRMYPVSWEEEKFTRYLDAVSRIGGVIPLGRLGLYKYVTVDSTFAMVERMLGVLPDYQAADSDARLESLKSIRGDWQN
jgi:UDP-galactopyranose mutase